jgi:hypothetical protein
VKDLTFNSFKWLNCLIVKGTILSNYSVMVAVVVVLIFAAISYFLYEYNYQMIREATELFGQVNNDVNNSELNTLDRM